MLVIASLLIMCTLSLWAAEKDTPAAKNTREKKLTAKISVDWKETPLQDIVKEIKDQIKEATDQELSIKFDTGVSGNKKLTFSGKEMPLADVLDGAFKKANLGYIVVSKEKDRMDGWILITQGEERGYPKGEEKVAKGGKAPAKKDDKKADKDDSSDKPEKKPAAAEDGDASEKKAASKLNLIKDLIKDGKKAKAKERLGDLIKEFPKTKAAEEAKELLESLK
jgi:hypothetical protein